MDPNEILRDLANSKSVSQKDYDILLHTQPYKVIINALNDRLKINQNPKTLLEIFRLANALILFEVIVQYKKTVVYLQDKMTTQDYKYATQQIKNAEEKLKPSSKQIDTTFSQKYHEYDSENRDLFVHHDNEPYVERKIEIPDDPEEFERMLFNASMENQNYYEFLLKYRYQKE